MLETKYRDIADGNPRVPNDTWMLIRPLETKYRDIADGNSLSDALRAHGQRVGNQVPRYSGWKHIPIPEKDLDVLNVGNQVPRYSGWKPSAAAKRKIPARHVENQVPRYSGYKSIAEREIPSCKAIFSHDD